jgi:UDP-N-acetylglucosamine:LPS N-acetylglucosamine transferase
VRTAPQGRFPPPGKGWSGRMTPHVSAGARILIVSGSFGAGHDRAADQLAARLGAAGLHTGRADFVELLPAGLGRMLRCAYHAQLRTIPATWGWLLSAAADSDDGGSGGAARLCALAERGLLRRVTPDTVAVISTYPLASQTLGGLRRTGRLHVPAVTFLTDMSVHPMWIAQGVDAHLAIHQVPAAQAREHGANRVIVCGPLVDAHMRPATGIGQKRAARAHFGLPLSGRLALVVAGSWGVGQVTRTAREIAATGVATPVVACGTNTAAQRRITRARGGIALGWVHDMAGLYRACDVVVQSGGGMSSLEALACGLPVLSYRPLPGHGLASAAALAQAGWAPWVRHRGDLPQALSTAAPVALPYGEVDIAALIGDLTGDLTGATATRAAWQPVVVAA